MLRLFAIIISMLTAMPALAQDEPWHHTSLSPSGDRIAYAQTRDGERAIFLLDLDTGNETGATIGEMQIESLYWASPTDLLAAMSGIFHQQTIDFNTENIEERASAIYRIDTENMQVIPLLSGDNRLDANLDLSRLAGLNHDRGEAMIPALAYSSGFGFLHTQNDILLHLKPTNLDVPRVHLFAIDLESGRGRLREAGGNDTIFWTVDNDGNAVWRIDWQEQSGDLRFTHPNGRTSGRATDLHSRPQIIGMTPSGSVAFMAAMPSGGMALFTAHPGQDGAARQVSPMDIGRLGPILTDHSTNTIVGFRFGDDHRQTGWMDTSLAEIDNALALALPDRIVEIQCWSSDRTRVLFSADDDIFIFDANIGQARLIRRNVAQRPVNETHNILN
jgi:hypothetical protein